MKANPFEQLDRLYVLTVPVNTPIVFPYMGPDGRLELFTTRSQAESAAAWLESNHHVRTKVTPYETRDAVTEFFRSCMHNGMVVFRLDNGTRDCREYKFSDLFTWHEATLIEERNIAVRYLLMRGKQYAYYRGRFTPEQLASPYGASLTEMELTMLYNAFRETWRGILYALVDRTETDADLDHYTVKAFELAKSWLEKPAIREAGFTPAALIHKPHQGGTLFTGPLKLFFVNHPSEQGIAAKGLVCAFTTYESALRGKQMFDNFNKPVTILALTAPELLGEAQQCAGVLIDMGETEYQVQKTQFSLWKTYGEFDAPIVVSLKNKNAASPADTKKEGESQ